MEISKIDERLIQFIYDEYQRHSVFQHYGQYPTVITKQFERRFGIDLGDAGAQLEAINRLLKQGWIETKPSRTNNIQLTDRVRRLTPLGIEYVEHSRKPGQALLGVAPTIAEMIGRFFKGFLGK